MESAAGDGVIDKDEGITFESLGVIPELAEACTKLGYKNPTKIQQEAIPYALEGRDVIGLAQTGSGKTAAFSLPILQKLLHDPSPFFACVVSPTRELAVQICDQIEALGSIIGVRCAAIVGGLDMMTQAIAISKRPHVIVCTPGRLVDHLEHTKGFNLRQLKFLVLDEADRLLDLDFETELEKIISCIPKERTTLLFSATMTTKVQKLQRASLRDPVKVQITAKYSTVDTLMQYYMFIPLKYKDCYLVFLLNEITGKTCIIFTLTCATSRKFATMLRCLGFEAICLNGNMPQTKRLGALNRFKAKERNILIATDVASRGLDIPNVDFVINYDVPQSSKDYIHRVGRTARAGRSGKSITFVTQYDIEWYQRIEHALGKKLPEYPLGSDKEVVLLFQERVADASRLAHIQLAEESSKETAKNKKKLSKSNSSSTIDKVSGYDDNDDTEEAVVNRLVKKTKIK